MKLLPLLALAFSAAAIADTPPPSTIFKMKGTSGQNCAITTLGTTVQCKQGGVSGDLLTWDGTKWIAQAAAPGGVSSVGGTSPIASSGGTTPVISIQNATTAQTGALTSTDWNTFNNKQAALGFTPPPNTRAINTTAPITGGGDLSADRTLACNVASGSQAGCLSSSDWTSFNGKQSSLSFTSPLVNTTGTISCNVASGSGAGCLSSANWTTFNDSATLTAAATSANTNSAIVRRGSSGEFASTSQTVSSRIALGPSASTSAATLQINQVDTNDYNGIQLCRQAGTFCWAFANTSATAGLALGQVGSNYSVFFKNTGWMSFSNGAGTGPFYPYEYAQSAGNTKPTLLSSWVTNSGSFNLPAIVFRSRATTTNGQSGFAIADPGDNVSTFFGEILTSPTGTITAEPFIAGKDAAGTLSYRVKLRANGQADWGGAAVTATCNGNTATIESGSNANVGRLTLPSSPGTSCAITLPSGFLNKPHCDATYEPASGTAYVKVAMGCSSATACTAVYASLVAGDAISFSCGGHL